MPMVLLLSGERAGIGPAESLSRCQSTCEPCDASRSAVRTLRPLRAASAGRARQVVDFGDALPEVFTPQIIHPQNLPQNLW